jgi:hypothetical protein
MHCDWPLPAKAGKEWDGGVLHSTGMIESRWYYPHLMGKEAARSQVNINQPLAGLEGLIRLWKRPP